MKGALPMVLRNPYKKEEKEFVNSFLAASNFEVHDDLDVITPKIYYLSPFSSFDYMPLHLRELRIISAISFRHIPTGILFKIDNNSIVICSKPKDAMYFSLQKCYKNFAVKKSLSCGKTPLQYIIDNLKPLLRNKRLEIERKLRQERREKQRQVMQSYNTHTETSDELEYKKSHIEKEFGETLPVRLMRCVSPEQFQELLIMIESGHIPDEATMKTISDKMHEFISILKAEYETKVEEKNRQIQEISNGNRDKTSRNMYMGIGPPS